MSQIIFKSKSSVYLHQCICRLQYAHKYQWLSTNYSTT